MKRVNEAVSETKAILDQVHKHMSYYLGLISELGEGADETAKRRILSELRRVRADLLRIASSCSDIYFFIPREEDNSAEALRRELFS